MIKRLCSTFRRPEYLLRPQNIVRRLLLRPFLKGRKVTVKLTCGFRIKAQEGEFIGNNLINTRCYDPAVTEAIWRLVDSGDICCDVGANIGYTALWMRARCGSQGRVYAYEPVPELWAALEANVATNRVGDNIVVRHSAVSDHVGTALFRKAGWQNQGMGQLIVDPSSDEGLESVNLITLDSTLSVDAIPAVIKIDVEGHEAAVLRGFSKGLASGRVRAVIFEEHGDWSAPSFALLRNLGYSIYKLSCGLQGPVLLPDGTPQAPGEICNYVATPRPDDVLRRFAARGWHVF